MPSAMKRFFSLGKKNKGHKFLEFSCHDDLRHSAYPISSTHQAPPPPPHTFAQRQLHHQNQIYPQQLMSPQAHIITQCSCQQCSYQQQQQQQQQLLGQQQAHLLASPTPAQPHPVVQHPQVQLQSQSQPQLQLQAQSPLTTTIQQYQPQQQQQHNQQQPQFAQHYVSQTAHISAPPVAQCTCQHCPYQQQLQQQQQQQQQQQHQHHTLPGQQIQLGQMVQINSATCQHQSTQMQLNQFPSPQPPQQLQHQQIQHHQQQQQNQQMYLNQGNIAHQQLAPQIAPILFQPSTPALQQQQQIQQEQQQQHQLQQQQPQQYQCHTIQSPQKQQHYHQRGQSLHQQPLSNQSQLIIQQQQQQHHQQQQQAQHQTRLQGERVELQSESHDFSRYANFPLKKKFEEHVYCNQKLERELSTKPTLPPYKAPPDYQTFLQQKRIQMNGQHLTYHNESLYVDYANLSKRFSPYGNLGISRQEPGSTT